MDAGLPRFVLLLPAGGLVWYLYSHYTHFSIGRDTDTLAPAAVWNAPGSVGERPLSGLLLT
jgi:hypothetical protein